MIHPFLASLMAGLLVFPSLVCADPPQLSGTSPLGVQRGKSIEVAFHGSGLVDKPTLIAPFGFQLEETTGSQPGATSWNVRLTVDVRTAIGVYPVRVLTDSGVSNPILFAVGQVGQLREVEPNNSFDIAQPIPNPTVIEGDCSGNDLDFFRFEGRTGDRVVVDAVCARLGSEVDPMIRLTTLGGRLVASADDTPGLVTDGYLTAVLPEDGAYVLEFCDSRFAGAGRTAYRLLIGAVPFAGEVYPLALPRGQNAALELRGGTLSIDCLFAQRTPSDPMCSMVYPSIPARLLGDPAWADSDLDLELPTPVLLGTSVAVYEPAESAPRLPAVTPPVTIMGRLSKQGEWDEYTIKAPSGSKYEVRVEAWELGSALDGQLRVFGKDGRLLGESDDGRAGGGRRAGGGGRRASGPTSTDPTFDLTMPEGEDEVKLVVKDLADRGGVGFTYRVVVAPAATAFQLALDVEQVAIPRCGVALIPVKVTRSGYDGPIALEVHGVPPEAGVTVLPGTIPVGQVNSVIGLKADSESELQALELQVVGRGADGQSVAAGGTVVFARQTITTPGFGMSGTIPSYTRPQVSLAAAVTKPSPILLAPESITLVVPQGSKAEAPLQVVRTIEEKAEYKIAALSSPSGLNVAELAVGATETSAKVQVTAAEDAALGLFTVGLIARTSTPESFPVAAALIVVEVVRPASLDLAAKEVVIEQGANVDLKGKIMRVTPFSKKVVVRFDGLPAGVTAEPVEIAAETSEFIVKLKAAADATPTEAQANAILTFNVGDKARSVVEAHLRLRVVSK